MSVLKKGESIYGGIRPTNPMANIDIGIFAHTVSDN